LPADMGCCPGIDLYLDPGGNGKGNGGDKHADTDLAQFGQRKDAINRRIDPCGEDRNQQHDKKRIRRLDLRWQEIVAKDYTIHVLGLQDPAEPV